MAIYHASQKPIKRSVGRSSVAAAAYRSASRLIDERTGRVHDYRAKGGVVATDLILPSGERLPDARRAEAWSQVEQAEKRKDACTAWEWTLAAPDELDRGQQRQLGIKFGQQIADRYGVLVDVALHSPDKAGDNRNWHYHVTRNTRLTSLDENGQLVFGRKADPDLSGRDRAKLNLGRSVDEVHAVRKLWCDLANAALESAGSDARIDHRSLKAQEIDREPTKHLGPHASAMKRKGIETDRNDMNLEARLVNEIAQLKAEAAAEKIDREKTAEKEVAQKAAQREAERVAQAEKWYAEIQAERAAEAAAQKATKISAPSPTPERPPPSQETPEPAPAPVKLTPAQLAARAAAAARGQGR